jgi:hypothetical protein
MTEKVGQALKREIINSENYYVEGTEINHNKERLCYNDLSQIHPPVFSRIGTIPFQNIVCHRQEVIGT